MSKEKEQVEEVEGELVEINEEAWVVDEWVDNLAAAKLVDMFVYSFKQGGNPVTGLTARAIEELCLMNEPKISIIMSTVDRTDTEVIAHATAQMVYYYPGRKETRPDGTVIETEPYEEPVQADGIRVEKRFFGNGREDPHAEMKALTKAMRAARRQLISQQKQIDAKKSLLKFQGGAAVPLDRQAIPQNTEQTQQAPPQSRQQQQDNDATKTAQKAMFAKYNERKPELEKLGITEDILKEGMYKFYGVKSRADMTVKEYRNCASSLDINGKFAKWILDLAPKKESESSEDDSPF